MNVIEKSCLSPLPLRQARPDGPAVSAMGLGCMGLSEFYGASDDAGSAALLDAALQAGVRFFDTADVYGNGHNERLVGRHLRGHPARAEIKLATKGGILRDPDDPARRGVDNTPAYLQDAANRSRDRLGTVIDLYYLHRVADGGAHVEASMEAMARLLADGVIGAVGLSEAGAGTIRRADVALRRLTNGRHGLAAVQTEYSLMTRVVEVDGVKAVCDELGILLVAYSPISRGLLADPGFDPQALALDDFRRSLPRFSATNLEHNRALAREVQALAHTLCATPAQVALAWVMSRGANVVPIPGTRSPSRLGENLAALNLVLPAAALLQLDKVFAHGAAAGTRYTAAAMAAYGMDR